MLLKVFMKQNNYYYMYIKKSDKIINIDEKLKKRWSVETMISEVFKNKHLIKNINNKKLNK